MKTVRILSIILLLGILLSMGTFAYDYSVAESTNSNGLNYLSGIIDNYSPFKNYLLIRSDDNTYILWVGDIKYSGFTFSCSNCDKYIYTYYSAAADRYSTTYNYSGVNDVVNISNRSYANVYSNIKGFNNSYGKVGFPITEFCLIMISIILLSFTIIHWKGRGHK